MKLDYRVFVWFDGDPNAASKIDRTSGWTLMAAYYYFQEALDYVAYASKSHKVRLKGPAFDRTYAPGSLGSVK